MKQILEYVGMLLFILGLMAAESESLIYSMVLMITGAVLYRLGVK